MLHVGLILAPCGRCDEVDGDILLAVDDLLDRQDETLVGVPSLGGVEEHSASLALIGDAAAVDVVGAGDVAVLVVVLGIAHGVDGDHGLDGSVVAVEHLLGQCAVHLDAVHLQCVGHVDVKLSHLLVVVVVEGDGGARIEVSVELIILRVVPLVALRAICPSESWCGDRAYRVIAHGARGCHGSPEAHVEKSHGGGALRA